MTKTQRKNPHGLWPPKAGQCEDHPQHRSGCKVGWVVYDTREHAEAAVAWARAEAAIQAERGYDFGYCAPGSIEELSDGKFRLCIP